MLGNVFTAYCHFITLAATVLPLFFWCLLNIKPFTKGH